MAHLTCSVAHWKAVRQAGRQASKRACESCCSGSYGRVPFSELPIALAGGRAGAPCARQAASLAGKRASRRTGRLAGRRELNSLSSAPADSMENARLLRAQRVERVTL